VINLLHHAENNVFVERMKALLDEYFYTDGEFKTKITESEKRGFMAKSGVDEEGFDELWQQIQRARRDREEGKTGKCRRVLPPQTMVSR